MEIITSHNSLDFDGLASMIAAGKLYPGARKVFSGTLKPNVKQFMGLYKDSLDIAMPHEMELADVRHAILVDTRNINRLGLLKDLAAMDCVYTVFDHHPNSEGDVVAEQSDVHEVGATTTIIVERIREQALELTPFEATILALGIYEDTGSLIFNSTTARDAAAVAFLLEKGANLSVVNRFMDSPFTSDQRQMMQTLLTNMVRHRINGVDITITSAVDKNFIPGLDSVAHRLFEVEACEALFVVTTLQGRVHVIARSRSSGVPVNEALLPVGGGGHDKAASAVVKGKTNEEVIAVILERLAAIAQPAMLAKDIMSSPVKSIPMDCTMEEAGKIMLRYGHTGMPVVTDGLLIGIISRRDVDKARTHNLGHAPVKGFMSHSVVTVGPETTVTEIQRLMVDRDIGRVPVIEDGRILGIVSRTDVLRTLHGDQYPEDYTPLFYRSEWETTTNYAALMESSLPPDILRLLKEAGRTAEQMGTSVYCVGGFVRDLLLGVANYDLDLVVEGDGIAYAVQLADDLGGRARVHERFKTSVVILPDGSKLDVATARTEYYEYPAALPKIEKSSIREDLYRRDFTINTMAICLNRDCFGDLIDYFGGKRDLNDGWIRILYNFSFIEDPTRILRAVRFANRYGFNVEPDTFRHGREAIARKVLGRVSFKRIQQELILILEEKNPLPALDILREIGVWPYILPEIKLDDDKNATLRRIQKTLEEMTNSGGFDDVRVWLIYMQAILLGVGREDLDRIIERYHFDRKAVKVLEMSMGIPEAARRLSSRPGARMSEMDRLIAGYAAENLICLLSMLDDDQAKSRVLEYWSCRQHVHMAMTGDDLKKMGIKPGPVYQQILSELKIMKMDGLLQSDEDEAATVKQWMEEGRWNVKL